MRNRVRGWRSLRHFAPSQAQGLVAAGATGITFDASPQPQDKLRFGLGLVGLALYLWVIHSYKLAVGDLAILVLGVGVLARGGKIRLPGFLMGFGLFILWAAISLSVSANVVTSTTALIDLVKLWIISFLIINVIKTPAELRFLVVLWLALFALYPIRGALFNQFICQCTAGRVAWNFIFSNPNDLAAFCLFPLGACAGIATVERNKYLRLAAMAGVAVLALVIMLTESRGAMLALGVGVILLPLLSRRRARDLVILSAVLAGAAVIAPKDVWIRMAGLTKVSVDDGMTGVDTEQSAASRWTIWEIAAVQVRDHPLTGIGIGMMPETNRWETARQGLVWDVRGERDTHSTYLRAAAETGIPGLLLYLGMWVAAIVKLQRARWATKHTRPREHQFLTFMMLAAISYLSASVFGTYFALAFTYLMLSMMWLSADILARNSWYVPAKATAALPAPSALAWKRGR